MTYLGPGIRAVQTEKSLRGYFLTAVDALCNRIWRLQILASLGSLFHWMSSLPLLLLASTVHTSPNLFFQKKEVKKEKEKKIWLSIPVSQALHLRPRYSVQQTQVPAPSLRDSHSPSCSQPTFPMAVWLPALSVCGFFHRRAGTVSLNPPPSPPSGSLQWAEIFTQPFQQHPPSVSDAHTCTFTYCCNTSRFPKAEKILPEKLKDSSGTKEWTNKAMQHRPLSFIPPPCTQTSCWKISA